MNGLWRSLIRFDRDKLAPGTAFRNAIGVAVPLAVGYAFGSPASGLVGVTGALNVSFQDGRDPYIRRGTRMVAASVLCAVAVFTGLLSGSNDTFAVAITLAWAFAAGLLVALDQPSADIGTISVVTLIVYGSHSTTVDQAFYSSLAALSGGLFQTLLSVALWPLRRFEPERRVLGDVYLELSKTAAAAPESTMAPPATAAMNEAQRLLSSLAVQRNIHAERLLMLLSESERIRLSLLLLRRLRVRLGRERGADAILADLNEFLALVASELDHTAESLSSGRLVQAASVRLTQISELVERIRVHCSDEGCPPALKRLLEETLHQTDALAGQIRAALDLAGAATPEGRIEFERRERRRPIYLRLISTIPILRANLTLESTACRHAIRLAACVAIAEAFARFTRIERGYWVPMTAAIILKPDFTSTFSRGVLRLAGTFTGLVLATALFHFLPSTFATEFLLIVIFTFVLRYVGGANYGIFVILISALVVALFVVAGVPARETIIARGIATVLGGILALVAYAIWPTWERSHLPETMAQMLDAYRSYIQILTQAFVRTDRSFAAELDRTRYAGRLARTNLEASLERFTAEPGVSPERAQAWSSLVASSHRFIRAAMALEAVLMHSDPVPARTAFERFTYGLEITLHSLAETLRGSPLTAQDLPDLRQAHNALVQSGDAFTERYALVNIETDRMTNSLNTLSGEVLGLLSPERRDQTETANSRPST